MRNLFDCVCPTSKVRKAFSDDKAMNFFLRKLQGISCQIPGRVRACVPPSTVPFSAAESEKIINITDYGFDPARLPAGYDIKDAARITAVCRDRYKFVCESGSGYARLKTGAYYFGENSCPTVGDFVLLNLQEHGDSLILKTLPRKSVFTRLDPSSAGHAGQAAAANFDYIFILQSLNHDLNPRRLERYLTQAWETGASPVVLLTKSDLTDNPARMTARTEAGVPVIPISAGTGWGLDALSPYLQPGKTTVFLGSSGVGKSTLVNALAGESLMSTGEIREDDSRGHHTTTHRQLILLSEKSLFPSAMIIDTPGMRQLGMWDSAEGLHTAFEDVERYFPYCRFRDCGHESEPGCAVRAAVARGELSEERLKSYLKLKREARYIEDRNAYLHEHSMRARKRMKERRQRKMEQR